MKSAIRDSGQAIAYYLLFSFLLFGMWEWLQTPFFKDITTDINSIVWFRLHCTLGDMLILTSCVALVSLLRRGTRWLSHPRFSDLLLVTALAVAYTGGSEYVNVHLRGSWGYSSWMPVLPLLGIGLVPLLQWLVLPTLILRVTRDHVSARRPAQVG